jgi:nucleotide-binding universal stress UspA family protein
MMWRRPVQAARSDRAASRPVAAPATPRPIVVGVDGSAASTRALEWAAVRALAGHTSLHIVHAVQVRIWWLDPYGLLPYWDIEPAEHAEHVLDEAVALVRRQAPLLPIITTLRGPDPAGALLDEGRTAQLIVLGRSRWPRGPRWAHVSVAGRVARRARGRVVLVGPDNEVLV